MGAWALFAVKQIMKDWHAINFGHGNGCLYKSSVESWENLDIQDVNPGKVWARPPSNDEKQSRDCFEGRREGGKIALEVLETASEKESCLE